MEVEDEVVADVRVLHVEQQPIVHDPLIAELVGGARPGDPAPLAEALVHRALRRRRLDRVKVVGAAGVADLLGEIVEQGQLVALEQLDFTLQVRRLQQRLVGHQTAVDVLDRMRKDVRGLVRLHRLARRVGLVEVDDADVDVLLAETAPHPRAAALDRTAHLGAEVLDPLNGVAGGRALLALRVGDVVGLELLVGPVVAPGSVEFVRAAFCHQVDADAAGLLRDVHAAGVDRHFLERVEVVVRGRRARGRHVRDVHAVERPFVVEGAGPARHVVGLLARHVAADVLAVHGDARRLLENDPRVAGRRDALQQLVGERLLRSCVARVDNRAFARDGNRFLNGRDGHLSINARAEPDGDDDAVADDSLETGELELHRICADSETGKLIRAGLAGHRRQRLQQNRAGEGDRHAGQQAARLIRHLAENLTGLHLSRRGGRARGEERQQREHDKSNLHSCPPEQKPTDVGTNAIRE